MLAICQEMIKLRELLTEHDIEWFDNSTIVSDKTVNKLVKLGHEKRYCDTTIYRTFFKFNGLEISVVNGYGTYGGYDPYTGDNSGLLEIWDGEHDIEGWLTAEQIISILGIDNETNQ